MAAALSRDVKVGLSEHASAIAKDRTALRCGRCRPASAPFLLGWIASSHPRTRECPARATGRQRKKVITVHNGVNLEKFRTGAVTEDIRAKYGIGPDTRADCVDLPVDPGRGSVT